MTRLILLIAFLCEWCGAAEATAKIGPRVVIAQQNEPGQRLVITGTVTRGGRPVPNVVLYLYHTNARGVYPKRGDEKGNGRMHGYLRGWLRTDATGSYRIETIRPASYPGQPDAAHIHVTVKEPGRDEYWIDAFEFDDDPRLTPAERRKRENRGGSGILRMTRDAKGVWHGVRHIRLP